MTKPGSEDILHYGTLRKSGRYEWGSGENPHQRNKQWLDHVDALKKKGLTEKQIADGMGMTTTQLRANKQIAKNEARKADEGLARKLKEAGNSNVAIGNQMGLNESSVRALLNPSELQKQDVLKNTSEMLKRNVDEKGFIDVGAGVERYMDISQTKLNTAIAMLEEEGYKVHKFSVEQLGTGQKTNMKVLAPPGTTYPDVLKNQDKIRTINEYSEDGGRTFLGIETPKAVSSKRVGVRYAEDGGAEKDGVIEIRRGVDDISLGGKKYAQVRVSVDGTHYLKGMAMYSDNLPDGVDMVFNTNKKDTGNKLDAMKPMKDDPDNPFGSSIKKQRHYIDKDGNQQLSAMNIVNEEGNWRDWSRNLSSQMLSKQSPALAKQQLDLAYQVRKNEYDEIMALTNPAVKKKLLQSFSDGADSASVKLQAAGLPRTRQHVILPINSLKDTEVFAPQYRNGEKVVLIRHPHGGIFEIPELTVNNRNRDAKSVMGQAIDAIGINSKVAQQLSGADFDGDTVLVIPNNSRSVRTKKPLQGLKDFDPQSAYAPYDGMKTMDGGTYNAKTRKVEFAPGRGPSSRTKQIKMGDVSNLITDMTIRGASDDELAKAIRHSMVVIDAEKHKLNWKQSAQDNQISQLKKKYQGKANAGSSTLISKASSPMLVDERKARAAQDGGPIDRATGKKMYTPTGASYVNKQGQTVIKKTKSTKMAEADDAFKLSSGTPMEAVYAEHANKLKSLANQSRKSMVSTGNLTYSPSAKKTYSREVQSLDAKLNVALKNAPLERQAQLLANATVSAKRQANPDMPAEDLKKIKGMALTEARTRTGAAKQRIDITPNEWNAIQAGAISNNKLNSILDNTDIDRVRELATPRTKTVMVPAKLKRAQAMMAQGYNQAEIADALGVPPSTLFDALKEGE